jgi:hypothetical protein
MFRSFCAAAVLAAIAFAAPAEAQNAPQLWWRSAQHPELDSDAIRSQCRLSAAILWPDTADAFDNEMRGRTYVECVTAQGRPLAPPQHGVDGRVN